MGRHFPLQTDQTRKVTGAVKMGVHMVRGLTVYLCSPTAKDIYLPVRLDTNKTYQPRRSSWVLGR